MLTNKEAAYEKLDLPHEPGEWIRIKHLSGTELEDAKAAKLKSVIRDMGDWSPEMRQEIRAARATQDAGQALASAIKDPSAEYDRRFVLHAAIVGWSYYEGELADMAPTAEDIDALDEDTMAFVFKAVVPQQRTESELKNG